MTMNVEEIRARLLDDKDHEPRWEYVSTLLDEVDAARDRTGRVRAAIDAALRVVNPVTHETTHRLLLDAVAVIDRDGGQAHEARNTGSDLSPTHRADDPKEPR